MGKQPKQNNKQSDGKFRCIHSNVTGLRDYDHINLGIAVLPASPWMR